MSKKSIKQQPDNPETASDSLTGQADQFKTIRCILAEQIYEQIQQLNNALFDKIDDALFAVPWQGHPNGTNNYLNAIREIRNKKAWFDEVFMSSLGAEVDSYLYQVKPVEKTQGKNPEETKSESLELDSENDSSRIIESKSFETKESVYEKMEIDLALQGMQRRAVKLYAPLNRQLNEIPDGQLRFGDSTTEANDDNMVLAVIQGLKSSRGVFNIPLELKLVFLKHFEQTLLLKMEMIYLGLINVLNNQADTDFMDQFISSADSVLNDKNERLKSAENKPESVSRKRDNEKGLKIVNKSIQTLIDDLFGEIRPPLFVDTMIKSNWRDVLLLIGLNQGVNSPGWNEAKKVISCLLQSLGDGQNEKSKEDDIDWLKNQIQQGFELIQLPKPERDDFFNKLEDHTTVPQQAKTVLQTGLIALNDAEEEKSGVKAAISEAGRKILDDDDLDDIVALLSDDQDQQMQKKPDETDDSLSGYLDLIDNLRDGEEIEFVSGGEVQKCKVQKSVTADNSYQIANRSGKVLLARSRVGLALSAKSGEIRVGGNSTLRPQSTLEQQTILQSHTDIDPPTTH